MSSRGWRTEALIVLGLVLGIAYLADLAGRYDLGHLGEAATAVGAVLAQVLAVFAARARQDKVSTLEAERDGDAGA